MESGARQELLNNIRQISNTLLGYELDEPQCAIVLSCYERIINKKLHTCVSGPAGTGKTQVCIVLMQLLNDAGYPTHCMTPTNKASSVLQTKMTASVHTIHKFLKLKPRILNNDVSQVQFVSTKSTKFKKRGVWIIDECSMVDDLLFKQLEDAAKKYNSHLIWFGDSKQLTPVLQKKIAKSFLQGGDLGLTKIHRQLGDVFIGKILEYLRKAPIPEFRSGGSELGRIEASNDFPSLWDKCGYLFTAAENLGVLNLVKCVAYTNRQVDKWNKYIRKLVHRDAAEPFVVGELLTAYDTLHESLINSMDYRITACEDSTIEILDLPLKAKKLTIADCNGNTTVIPVLYANTLQTMNALAFRLDALAKKKSIDLVVSTTSSFATLYDITYQSRVLKRKTLDYGYCISVHKSQASTYESVIVDMKDLKMATGEELRQLQYVALSRARQNIYIFQ